MNFRPKLGLRPENFLCTFPGKGDRKQLLVERKSLLICKMYFGHYFQQVLFMKVVSWLKCCGHILPEWYQASPVSLPVDDSGQDCH